jgi:transcriptional regulator with XRE-family HTH domain
MRELKAKTPEELAEGAGLKKSMILNLERGKDEPRLSTLEKCMGAPSVSMAAFEEMLALAQTPAREGAGNRAMVFLV